MKAWALPAALLLLANDANGAIEVTVSGIHSAAGRVVVEVCPQARFLTACPLKVTVPAQKGSVSAVVRDVPPGRYAVQAYHDANANDDLDRGWFGIPKEGIGFSNDAMPRLVRPKWEVAAFDHGRDAQHVGVTLRYFLG